MSMDKYTEKDHHEDVKSCMAWAMLKNCRGHVEVFKLCHLVFHYLHSVRAVSNSFAQAISSVGGAGAALATVVGCVLSGMFALSMAQIASAFPTCGRPLSLGFDSRQPVLGLADGLATARSDHRFGRHQHRRPISSRALLVACLVRQRPTAL